MSSVKKIYSCWLSMRANMISTCIYVVRSNKLEVPLYLVNNYFVLPSQQTKCSVKQPPVVNVAQPVSSFDFCEIKRIYSLWRKRPTNFMFDSITMFRLVESSICFTGPFVITCKNLELYGWKYDFLNPGSKNRFSAPTLLYVTFGQNVLKQSLYS